MPQEGWFVGVNGVPLGPIPLADLRELAMAGHVDRRSLVWREGQAEWRPLGKFPNLLRVIEEGPAIPAPISLDEPAPARLDGHSGEKTASAETTDVERPSAWGDLDDEDDEDEQPTVVKGRVSIAPAGLGGVGGDILSATGFGAPGAFGAAAPLPPLAPPPAPPNAMAQPASAASVTVTSMAAMGAPARAAFSAPPFAPEPGPASTISTTPQPLIEGVDAQMARSRRRGVVFIGFAVAAAFALGAILMHVFSGGGEDARGTAPDTAERVSPAAETEAGRPPPAAKEAASPPSPPPPVPAQTQPGGGRSAPAPLNKPAVTTLPTAVTARDTAAAPKAPAPSLLAGLAAPNTPGPALAPRFGDAPSGGAGLDATTIQRTVRRYGPAVRQNCWQRALNARAPGVPTSAKVTATITVDSTGKVQAVDVAGAPKGYPGLAKCIETSVRGWMFPRSGGETVTNVPFMFVGQ